MELVNLRKINSFTGISQGVYLRNNSESLLLKCQFIASSFNQIKHFLFCNKLFACINYSTVGFLISDPLSLPSPRFNPPLPFSPLIRTLLFIRDQGVTDNSLQTEVYYQTKTWYFSLFVTEFVAKLSNQR